MVPAIVTRRGGLPVSPDTSSSPVIWEDWRPSETEERDRPAIVPRAVPQSSLQEATDVVVDVNGQVKFVALTGIGAKPPMATHQNSCNLRANG